MNNTFPKVTSEFEIYDRPSIYQIGFGKSLIRELHFYEALFKKYSTKKIKKIIDWGCGTGQFVMALAEKGYECLGIDLNANMIKYAKKESKRLGLSVKLIEGKMEEYKSEQLYDACICTAGTIHHLYREDTIVRHFENVFASLCSGGLYVLDLLVTRIEDEPVEIEQEWEAIEAGTRIKLKMNFDTSRFNLTERKRWVTLESEVQENNSSNQFKNQHWFRIVLEEEFLKMVEKCGFELLGWYGRPNIKSKVKYPARHSFVYCILQKAS